MYSFFGLSSCRWCEVIVTLVGPSSRLVRIVPCVSSGLSSRKLKNGYFFFFFYFAVRGSMDLPLDLTPGTEGSWYFRFSFVCFSPVNFLNYCRDFWLVFPFSRLFIFCICPQFSLSPNCPLYIVPVPFPIFLNECVWGVMIKSHVIEQDGQLCRNCKDVLRFGTASDFYTTCQIVNFRILRDSRLVHTFW